MLQVRIIIWLNFHHEKLSNRNTIRYNIWKKGHINQTILIFKSIKGISGGEEKTCKEWNVKPLGQKFYLWKPKSIPPHPQNNDSVLMLFVKWFFDRKTMNIFKIVFSFNS